MRPHRLAVLVAQDSDGGAAGIPCRNELARERAHPDGVDGDPRRRRPLGLGEPLALEILSVGEQHHHLLPPRLGRQRVRGDVDPSPDVGPAARDRGRVERIDGLEQRRMIERHGALQERVAGEGDEADAVSGEPVDEVVDRELGPLEPARLHVVRVHAPGRVDDQQEIGAGPLHRLPVHALLRTGERDEAHRDGGRDDDDAQPAAGAGGRSRARAKPRSFQQGQRARGKNLAASHDRAEEGHGDESDEQPLRFSESHVHSPEGGTRARGGSASPTGRARRGRGTGPAPRTSRTARRAA